MLETENSLDQPQDTAPQVNVPSVLQRVKRVAQLFNQSPKINAMLRAELKTRNEPERCLVQEVLTRWNSAYAMLERYHKLSDAICVVLVKAGKAEFVLRQEELDIIPDILSCLAPFLEITKVMSQETVPTISLIVPYVTSLIQEMTNMQLTLTTAIGRSFSSCLLSQSRKRLLRYEENTVAR